MYNSFYNIILIVFGQFYQWFDMSPDIFLYTYNEITIHSISNMHLLFYFLFIL